MQMWQTWRYLPSVCCWKNLSRLMLNILYSSLLDSVLSEWQFGVRSARKTVNMIFTLRQWEEKVGEHAKDLFVTFVGLTKAFNTVPTNVLWIVLKKHDVPERMFSVIMCSHQGMMVSVRFSEEVSDPFIVCKWTKLVVFLHFSYLICIFLSCWKKHLRILKKVWDLNTGQVVGCSINNESKQELRRFYTLRASLCRWLHTPSQHHWG